MPDWRTFRAPVGLLMIAAYALALAASAVLFYLLSAPANGVTVLQQGSAIRVDAEGRPSFVVPAESLVTVAGNGPDIAFRAKELVADYTPDGPGRALRDWYGRQADLASLGRRGGVRLRFTAATGEPTVIPRVRLRRVGDLSPDAWLLLVQALGVGLLGAWLLVLKARDAAARLYGAACAGLVITGLSGALYDGRDLLQGGWWLWGAQAVNLAGIGLCSGSLLGLYLLLPRRLAPPALAWAPAAIGLLVAGLVALGTAPLVVWYGSLLATAPICASLMLVQWFVARDRPQDRAVILYLGAVTVGGMGLLTAFMAIPVLFGVPALMGDGAAAFPVLLVFAGTAFGVRRRRLFELEAWAHRIIGALGWTLAVLLCDAALVWGLSLAAANASAIALIAVSFVYFPLRSRLHQRASGRSKRSDIELFQGSAGVAFTRDPGEREQRWRALLDLAYAPLAIEPSSGGGTAAHLDRDGARLHIPATSAGPAMALAHCSGGRRLFGASDLTLAGELLDVLARADAARAEYLRGAVEERGRIAQDLHDDINARLLTSLHRSDLTHVRSDVRKALADIRTMMDGLAGETSPVLQLLADLRFETAERLDAAGLSLQWPPTDSAADATLEPAAARALTAGLRELVSNVIRHSGASSVEVEARLSSGRLNVAFCDDGVGIAPRPERDRGGLHNVKERVQRAGGKVVLSDETGGFQVRLSLPVEASAAASHPAEAS